MYSDLDLALLRAFVAVAEEGQFVEAARRLKTSQSVISQRIKRIEDMLGAPVMVRGRHGLSLTEAGDVLLVEAREILERSQRGMRRVVDCIEGRVGNLTIGVAPWLLYGLAPKLLSLSRGEAPEKRIGLESCNSSFQAAALVNRQIDLGIFIQFELLEGVTCIPLFPIECAIVMSSENPLCSKSLLEWGDLYGQQIVVPHYQSSYSFLEAIRSGCSSVVANPLVVKKAMPVRSVMAYIAAGDGVGFVPNLPPISAYGLQVRRLVDAPVVGVGLCHRTDDDRNSVHQLIDLAVKRKADLRAAMLGIKLAQAVTSDA